MKIMKHVGITRSSSESAWQLKRSRAPPQVCQVCRILDQIARAVWLQLRSSKFEPKERILGHDCGKHCQFCISTLAISEFFFKRQRKDMEGPDLLNDNWEGTATA